MAEKHLQDILSIALEHSPDRKAVVVFDSRCELAMTMTGAYRRCLPGAKFIDFDAVSPESILAAFAALAPSDLAVLIQSTSFRLAAFRIRVELFQRGIKVIEHPHLYRMGGEEAIRYVESLAYDPEYYRGVGGRLKERIDAARSAVVDGGGEFLVFSSPFEPAKLNVGDYRGMKNVGGQFPIGEVFTEARNLEAVAGRARIFAFADTEFQVNKPGKPITLAVTKGKIAGALDSTPEFEKVLAGIRADEGEIWIREIGFGLNRAFGPDRLVGDVGTFERACGIHLSLGAKHAVYAKPGIRRKSSKHHVDVFVAVESVRLDDAVVFRNGAWVV